MFCFLEDESETGQFSCSCVTGGKCFYYASSVFYYLEVLTWKVLSAFSSHWLQCHPVLQSGSMWSERTPHPTADVSPMKHLLSCTPSSETPGPHFRFSRTLRCMLKSILNQTVQEYLATYLKISMCLNILPSWKETAYFFTFCGRCNNMSFCLNIKSSFWKK